MKIAAIKGVVYGTIHATINATLRRPMAVADVIMLRTSRGIRYVTSMDTVWHTNATVRNGPATTPASFVSRRMNRMWRMSSFVGDPCAVTAPGLRRDTQRRMMGRDRGQACARRDAAARHPHDHHEGGMGDGIADVVQARPELTRDSEFDGEYAVEVIHDVVVEHQRNQIVSPAVEHEYANRQHPENRDEVGRAPCANDL